MGSIRRKLITYEHGVAGSDALTTALRVAHHSPEGLGAHVDISIVVQRPAAWLLAARHQLHRRTRRNRVARIDPGLHLREQNENRGRRSRRRAAAGPTASSAACYIAQQQ